MSVEHEDYELENRRMEVELERGDQKLKLQQEDEVLYGSRAVIIEHPPYLIRAKDSKE